MSILDRIRADMLDAELRTGKKALQVIVGQAEAAELFFINVCDRKPAFVMGVPLTIDIFMNGITVVTNKEDMR